MKQPYTKPDFQVIELNEHGVSLVGDDVVFPWVMPTTMSKAAALAHAACIVALADDSENFETFRTILRKVLDELRVIK